LEVLGYRLKIEPIEGEEVTHHNVHSLGRRAY